MEVAEHGVAPPPPHHADGVWINTCHEESQRPYGEDGARADVPFREAGGQASCLDDLLDGCGNLYTTDLMTLVGVVHTGNGGVAGVTMASKVRHFAMH